MFRRSDDAERFRAWQREAVRAKPPKGFELVPVGPFQVFVSPGPRVNAWVSLPDPDVEEIEVRSYVPRLRRMFKRLDAELEIEFSEEVLPKAGRWLEAAGMKLVERNPLMAVTPGFLRPFKAPEVTLARLEPTSSDADLAAFQNIRWTDGNLVGRPVPSIEVLRKELSAKESIYLLAWLDGEPVGTGVSHRLKKAAEIVGIVTRSDKRRRGVASTVSSELVARHFDSGGDFVFLDAANDEAVRVYQRLGFMRFGSNVVYR